ncbi:hypothetical protein Hdeb2414_s0021g00576421 [Helianthus debilis subsp. tardiflorus]
MAIAFSNNKQSRHHTEDSDVDSFRDSSSDVSSDYNLPKSEFFQWLDQLSLNYQHVLQEGFSGDEGESIFDLVCRFIDLKSMKSCDLFSSSWLSVAWYPIYRSPMGPALKDLNAVFLPFILFIHQSQAMDVFTTSSAKSIRLKVAGFGGAKRTCRSIIGTTGSLVK